MAVQISFQILYFFAVLAPWSAHTIPSIVQALAQAEGALIKKVISSLRLTCKISLNNFFGQSRARVEAITFEARALIALIYCAAH